MADKNNTIKTTVEIDSTGAEKGIQNINDATKESASITDDAAKSQSKFSKAIQGTDEASGGLITKFKTLSATPLVAIVGVLVGAFKFLQEAVGRSGKATELFSKIGAKFSGVLNGLLSVLEPVVIFLGEKLLDAINDPAQAFEDLGDTIKNNVINRFKALSVLGGAVAKLLKGDFKGAAKEATDGMIQLTTGIADATDKAKDFAETAKVAFNEAAEATDRLANVEERLVRNRIALEKQQLTSLRLAEEERQIRDDVSKSIEERIDANVRLGEVLDEQMQRELAVASQNLNFARLQQQATGDTISNIEAVGDAEIKLLEIRERIAGQKSEQLVNENSLLKEQEDLIVKQSEDEDKRAKEARQAKEEEDDRLLDKFVEDFERQLEYDQLELERLEANGQATNEIEAEIIKNKAEIEIAQARGSASQIELIETQKQIALDKLTKATAKSKKDSEAAQLENTIAGIGEAFGFEQEAALAKQLIAAPEAIGNIFKTAAAKPTISGRIIHATTGLATVVPPIYEGIKAIKNARFSGSKGGSGASASAATPSIPSISAGGSSVTPEVIDDLSANSSANLGTDTSIGDSATASASNNISASTQGQIVFSEDSFTKFQEQISFKESKSTII